MVTMFNLRQASLLFIQLLKMQNVFEVSATQLEVHKNMSVSCGDPVMFICNISDNATTLIEWNNDQLRFAYSTSLNQTSSNFSSERVEIDCNISSTLSIFKARHNDSGLCTCTVSDGGDIQNMTCNLNVPNKQGVNFSRYIFFILSPAIGLFICCITLVVCLCKKSGRGRQDQGPVYNQHQHSQSQPEPIYEQVNLPANSDCWRNAQQRRMYIEKLNSIYDPL
ncbi:uncharacterized protein LOC111609240 [Xiphophorus maculatus]|uniref:uncharacterized protein LOC111609240 n=1 Tax=Xiphophorus maculatus TaxID=8083 RepID=UPI000C6DDE26|nr:uncharacterized protein LOC111609240 [Xiphophorus maculatus]XP_023192282.1 uncharacterized protein LOC111609240 [Xiphophorus maculatus]